MGVYRVACYGNIVHIVSLDCNLLRNNMRHSALFVADYLVSSHALGQCSAVKLCEGAQYPGYPDSLMIAAYNQRYINSA